MTMQNLLFCAHTICMSYVTNTFLLVSSSVRSKKIVFFCTVNAKKANKTYNKEVCWVS